MSATTKTWRTLFPVHPAADVFPMMSADELHELGEDIKANGLQQPIVLLQDNADSHIASRAPYYVLDGRNRLAAMERAGIPVPREPFQDPTLFERKCAYKWRADVIGGSTKWTPMAPPLVDPARFVIGANVRRRHLTKEQQADLILRTVEAASEFSATSAENSEAEAPKAGRPKDLVLEKAVTEAAKQGISKRTVEAAPTIEPLNSARAQTLLRQLENELYRLVERGQKVQRLGDELHASPRLITELIDRGAKRENARIAKVSWEGDRR